MRQEQDVFTLIFNRPEYQKYAAFWSNLNEIVNSGNKNILDAYLPTDLINEVLLKSQRCVYLDSENKVFYSYENIATDKRVTLFEAYEILGASKLDELLERTVMEL